MYSFKTNQAYVLSLALGYAWKRAFPIVTARVYINAVPMAADIPVNNQTIGSNTSFSDFCRTYAASSGLQARFSGISSCPAIAVVGTLASHLGDPGSIPLPVASASWTIEVTLHVFSGKPDPEYVIPRNTKSYDVILKAIGDTSTPLGERLGYNGFTVTLIREASRWTVGWCTRPVVELRILAAVSAMTPRGHQHPLQAGVIDYVKESILSCKG
ncbi:hypothetical protein DPMN_142797 [Dreissena polymorpha]|uniref:Uncharacterized protein n=1 Tax=Dreissena polymorpha TaxID=45954 RepID=A0A9D4GF22_DREPO|nr:hypothetical protein DPMN_142797 [Dreissena polymorpha]